MPTDNFFIPLPSSGNPIVVDSFSEPGVSYKVDLVKMSCSCPDFVGRRSQYPVGTVTRACKHLKQELLKLPEIRNSLTYAVLEDKYFQKHYYYDPKIPLIVGYTKDKEWVSVFAKSGPKTFQKFGYSLLEHRWAYDTEPKDEDKILEIIHSFFQLSDDYSDEESEMQIGLEHSMLKNPLKEFYELCNSVLEDDLIDEQELQMIMQFFKDNPRVVVLEEFQKLVAIFSGALEDHRIDLKEMKLLKRSLRAIAKQLE